MQESIREAPQAVALAGTGWPATPSSRRASPSNVSPPGSSDPGRRVAGRVLWALVAAAATFVTVQHPMSDNLRYVVGLLRVSGFPPGQTFTHRPMAYRLLVAAQAGLSDAVTSGAGAPHSLERLAAFETGMNVVASAWALSAALLLWAGLRRLTPQTAWVYGVGAYAALAFLTPMLGEPDWYAAMFAVAAVGAGLLGGRLLGGTLGGVLLALAALGKFVTLPVALAALLVLWGLDRQRAVVAAFAAFAFGSMSLFALWVWAPWEIGWMLDIRALQPPFWNGLNTLSAMRDTAVQLAVMWPAVLLLPAAFVGVSRKERLLTGGILVLAAAPVVLQGEYWLYHSINVVVVAGLAAVRTLLRSRGALAWPVLACSVWTAQVFVLPWRFHLYAGLNRGPDLVAHGRLVVLVAVACAAVLVVLQWWALRRRATRPDPARAGRTRVAFVVLAAALASQVPPALTAAFDSRADRNQDAATVRAVVGEAQVVYLTPGWATYYLGNPTHCRYPSPLFLQRQRAAAVVDPTHRGESLDCVSQDGARWLVWNRQWLDPATAAPDVLAAVESTWDCDRAQVRAGYVLCPRKT